MNRRSRPLAPQLRRAALRVYVALILLLLLLPVGIIALASFSNTSYLAVPPKGLTLRWYAEVLNDAAYLDAIGFSLLLACGATVSSLVLGLAGSYALIRRAVPAAQLISATLMAPLVFPGVVIGVALLQLYSLVGISASFPALLLAHMVITVPYVVRAVLASLDGTDPTLEDAARVLGANRWVAFFRVTLPVIRPGLAAGALFSFIVSFDNVPVTIFLLGAHQNTLPVKIFTSIEYGVDPTVAAISSLLIAATGLFLVAAERWMGFHRFV